MTRAEIVPLTFGGLRKCKMPVDAHEQTARVRLNVRIWVKIAWYVLVMNSFDSEEGLMALCSPIKPRFSYNAESSTMTLRRPIWLPNIGDRTVTFGVGSILQAGTLETLISNHEYQRATMRRALSPAANGAVPRFGPNEPTIFRVVAISEACVALMLWDRSTSAWDFARPIDIVDFDPTTSLWTVGALVLQDLTLTSDPSAKIHFGRRTYL
jgi:hypothetical protein